MSDNNTQLQSISYKDLAFGEESGFENARERFDAKELAQLADSIEADGLLYPVVVWQPKEQPDKSIVIDGERRSRAIGAILERNPSHALKRVPIRLIEADTLKEARYKALAGNLQRADLSSYELAQECYRLKAMGDTQKQIASGLHKSESWVSRKLNAFENAVPALKKAWRSGLLPDDTVEDIAQLDADEQEEAVEEQLATRKNGHKSKGSARKKAKKAAKKLQRASTKELQELLMYAERAPSDQPYLQGLHDAWNFALGGIEEDGLKAEWRKFKKAIDKKIAEEAEAKGETEESDEE